MSNLDRKPTHKSQIKLIYIQERMKYISGRTFTNFIYELI